MGPNSVHDLDIWRESVCFVKNIYELTSLWPRDERFGIIAQARRAAVSIPANLAEGRGRQSAPEMRRFAHIALGSCYELDTLLAIAAELEYETTENIANLRKILASITRRIQSFVRYQESKSR